MGVGKNYRAYMPAYQSQKRTFWDDLWSRVSSQNLPWLLFGDLNEVVSEHEKFKGRNIWRKKLFLKPFLQDCGRVDLGFSGSKFIWSNNQEGLAPIKERKDRAIANKRCLAEND